MKAWFNMDYCNNEDTGKYKRTLDVTDISSFFSINIFTNNF